MDDDESILIAIQRLLHAYSFGTETFNSGRAFLDALQAHSPDCALLDLHMLGLTGWEVQAEMEASGFFIPVIFITGDGDPAVLERVKTINAAALLLKPFGKQELLEAITLTIKKGNPMSQKQFVLLN